MGNSRKSEPKMRSKSKGYWLIVLCVGHMRKLSESLGFKILQSMDWAIAILYMSFTLFESKLRKINAGA